MSYTVKKKGVCMSDRWLHVDTSGFVGMFWFAGWLFTLAFARLLWWQAILGLVIWPYYLGTALR